MKIENDVQISEAEWEVMRIVWTLKTVHTSDVIKQLQAKKGWSESTIKTLMRRLEKKGMLLVAKEGHRFTYTAAVDQNEMMYKAIKNSFDQMCDMHKGDVVIRLLKDIPLSSKDIDKMIDILEQKRQTAPEKVSCNCLNDCEAVNGC